MKRFKELIAKYAMDILIAVGAVAVSVGVAMIYLPAGIITAGVLLIIGAAVSSIGGGGST